MNLFENLTNLISGNPYLFGTFFFFFGTIVASFFNVVILRYPKVIDYESSLEVQQWFEEKNIPIPTELNKFEKLSLSFPASHCYSCHTPLKGYHNIPIFSYLFLKGKCGHCNAHISIQYPIIEFIGGLVMLFSYLHFMPLGLLYFIFGSIFLMSLYVSSSIDFKSLLLPDGNTYFLLWSGLLLSVFDFSFMHLSLRESILGAVTGYLLCRITSDLAKLIKGYPMMGDGDLKLLAMLGVFVGIKGAVFTFFAAPFFGIFTWIIFKLMKTKEPEFPYGPSLIFAGLYYLLYPSYIPEIVSQLLSLIPSI
jgi:leader peptidase (prepilin peptidase)/N-methyltransferase